MPDNPLTGQIDANWKIANNPIGGHGGAGAVVFNPQNPQEKVLIDTNSARYNQVAEFLGPNWFVNSDQLGQFFGADPSGRFVSVFRGDTVEKGEELARIAAQGSNVHGGTRTAGSNISLDLPPVQNSPIQGTEQVPTVPSPGFPQPGILPATNPAISQFSNTPTNQLAKIQTGGDINIPFAQASNNNGLANLVASQQRKSTFKNIGF